MDMRQPFRGHAVPNREYQGFSINVSAIKMASGGYGAAVILRVESRERSFEVPLDEDLLSEDEAFQEALQYACDLIDGLLPWFDPRTMIEDPALEPPTEAHASLRSAAA
jgi:hypothetical protein